jgi:putative hydrolase of the HAD superfamily
MNKILLLDFDHTLYPPNLTTLKAVDDRINLYIREFLGFTVEGADALRLKLWDEYGTTLKGLEVHHGVDRDHYCDFIHAIEEAHLPPPDPALNAWLGRLADPFYIFTNARRDWAERGLIAMGLASILPESDAAHKLRGIFDIAFMDWEGKPNPGAYAKVDRHLREHHGEDIQVWFADDRADNLQEAARSGWSTIWIVPEGSGPAPADAAFDRTVPSLTLLDPETFA